ncbi:unnamed protein product [Ectocarpus sp. 12 AP-2014]
MSTIAFATPAATLLGASAPLPLLRSISPAAAHPQCAPPPVRMYVRKRPSFRRLLAAGSRDADQEAEESYYQRQAARKSFADDVQTSIQERQQQERQQMAAAGGVAGGFSPHDENASAGPRGSPSSIRDIRSRNRERLKKFSKQQQQPRYTSSSSSRPGGSGGGSGGKTRPVHRPAAGVGGTEISHDTSMRQGKFLFTVKQMKNRRDFGAVLKLLHEAERRGDGATPKMYSCCIGYMGKGGNWEGALDVLDRMHALGNKPDAFCINDGMNACTRARKYDKALWVFEQARDVWGAQLDSYVSSLKEEHDNLKRDSRTAVTEMQTTRTERDQLTLLRLLFVFAMSAHRLWPHRTRCTTRPSPCAPAASRARGRWAS